MAIFRRNRQTGELTQLHGKAGCIAVRAGEDECREGRALRGAVDITTSPDGANVYVAGKRGIAIFDRSS